MEQVSETGVCSMNSNFTNAKIEHKMDLSIECGNFKLTFKSASWVIALTRFFQLILVTIWQISCRPTDPWMIPTVSSANRTY